MAAASPVLTEATPLLPSSLANTQHKTSGSHKPIRNVTFNTQIVTDARIRERPSTSTYTPQTAKDSTSAMMSGYNSKVRRRHSQGSPLTLFPPTTLSSKIGPQRTTRTAQKLKLLPSPENGDEEPDEESGREVYSQFTRIKDPTARRDAARLGKDDRNTLPRVTAFCTANSYRLDDLLRFLKGRATSRSANPKSFDECIYTPYTYTKFEDRNVDMSARSEVHSSQQRRFSDSAIEVDETTQRIRDELSEMQHEISTYRETLPGEAMTTEEVLPSAIEQMEHQDSPDFDTSVHIPEVFLFDYGVVVIWGMSITEEQRFLKEIAKFEVEKLAKDNVQVENFNFYYTRQYSARIYNDFISLREKRNYMTKLAISHALAQSTKTSLYEDLVDNTIETTKEIPATIALTGRIKLSRKEINMQIGELFILRINIHLQGSVLDAPELMWAEPQLNPVYLAVRSYLEMDQRVSLLTERLNVIADLLQVLKDQLTHTHGEYLEWIVIVLIAAEIIVACINIVVDIYAGGD